MAGAETRMVVETNFMLKRVCRRCSNRYHYSVYVGGTACWMCSYADEVVEVPPRELVYHAGNGAVVLHTLNEKGAVIHRELVARLVYVDQELAKTLVQAVRLHLVRSARLLG
jgi:hypothetical protein